MKTTRMSPHQEKWLSGIVVDLDYCGIVVTDAEGCVLCSNKTADHLFENNHHHGDNGGQLHKLDAGLLLKIRDTLKTKKAVFGLTGIIRDDLIVNVIPIEHENEWAAMIQLFIPTSNDEETADPAIPYAHSLASEVEAIIESSYDGIFVTDGNANTIRANSAYEKITGIKIPQVMGRNMRDLVEEGVINESVTLKVLEERTRITIPQTLNTGKQALVTGNPIFDKNGTIVMVVTNLRDMTELIDLNQRLEKSLEVTLAYKKKLKDLQSQVSQQGNFIKISKKMRSIDEVIDTVSKTDATVLILGETGVGKDRIAEEIHNRSHRVDKGLCVRINCGAIPESLLESELFGYEKGAFTGANKEGKAGLFEVADGGTLFLDEVESMPLVIQSKLLRVLQDFEILRVGSIKPRNVNVRLICASNEDLQQLIAEKKFRADLFYRLNVIPINVPPLRERTEDIPYLATFFIDKFNQKYGKKVFLSEETVNIFIEHRWPGNVRELENLVERLVVMSTGNCIRIHNLPTDIFPSSKIGVSDQIFDIKQHIKDIEFSFIHDAIKKYGSARKAASHIGMNQSTLTRKMREYKASKS